MLYLLLENEYRSFSWCRRTLYGLEEEARRKRLTLSEIQSVKQVPSEDSEAGIILIGATENWLCTQISNVTELGYYPISLTNRLFPSINSVAMDLWDSIRLSVNYLHSLGRTNLALYGVNPHSSSDADRVSAFLHLTGRKEDIYPLESDYTELFKRFQEHVSAYDSIICVNDYAALSLCRHLKEIGINPTITPYIIGIGNMKISQISNPTITSVSDDYEYFGRAAVFIYNLVIREKTISNISIQLKSKLHIRQTTGNEPYQNISADAVKSFPCTHAPNMFYHDKEVADMAKLEVLFNHCDNTDHQIIQKLLTNISYAEIAHQCFLSETAIKYRVHKMMNFCGVNSRLDLEKYLRKFFL